MPTTGPDETRAAQDDLVFDGERFIPGAGVGIAYEHWSRYALAASLVAGREILEVACGEGYGSAFLARSARSVRSFDASAQAVAHARQTYAASGVTYEHADVRTFFGRCPDASFDAVVAFEIIEHLTVEDQAFLLDNLPRVLRPGGFALISTPDKRIYTDASLAVNPFHVREYYRDEFEAELRSRFTHVRLLDQALFTGCAVVEAGAETARTVQMSWTDQRTAQGIARAGLRVSGEYVVALAGRDPLPESPSLVLADFSRKLIAEGLQAERRAADRLARELEEARRAWEAAAAGGRAAREQLEAARAEAAAAQQSLATERERYAAVLLDLQQVQAEAADGRRALRAMGKALGGRRAGRLGALRRVLGEVPARQWLQPVAAARSLRALAREQRDAALIESSGLIDRAYYFAENEDVALSGMDPLLHFLRHGAAERRNPHPLFDTGFYLATNPDVAGSGENPLAHFLAHGWKEARRPHPCFDPAFYLSRNPDVAASGANPLVHYLEWGASEGRDPNPEFATGRYLAENPEIAATGENPLIHFLRRRRHPGGARRLVATAGLHSPLGRWRAEMANRPLRALVVDLTALTPDRDSGSMTTLELMKALQALGYAVTFVPADLQHRPGPVEALEQAGFWCLTGRAAGSMQQILEACGDLFQVVVLCRVDVACHLAGPVREHCRDAALLFETMDLHYLRGEREAAITGSKETAAQAQATKRIELDVVRRADATLVHSEVEEQILRTEVPQAALYRVPYVLNVSGPGPGFDARKDIVFLGGFRHKPNVDAVSWFVREILPRIRKQLPGVRFLIVGSDPTDEVKALATGDVIVTGYIEQLRPVFDACRVAVAPLRYGAGYKGKVAMSLAHGVPIVLTGLAAEGMELSHEGQVLIADDPDAFAAAVVRLYRDRGLWERLARAAIEFATDRFSPGAARMQLEQILRASGASLLPDVVRESDATPARGEPGVAIFPSRFMQALHGKLGVRFGASALVPHGVVFHHAPDAPRADRRTLLQPGTLQLLFAGRVTRFKGLHTAIEALPEVLKALPDLAVRLTVVGEASDAAYVASCRQLAGKLGVGDHVVFQPPAREEELFALFQRHDLYLFPSLFEPFALTLLLALEAGIPTVATAAGGNVDIVKDRETGLLFPPGAAAALAGAVVELARDPALRQGVSEGGRAAAEKLTMDTMLDRIEVTLQNASRRSSAGG